MTTEPQPSTFAARLAELHAAAARAFIAITESDNELEIDNAIAALGAILTDEDLEEERLRVRREFHGASTRRNR